MQSYLVEELLREAVELKKKLRYIAENTGYAIVDREEKDYFMKQYNLSLSHVSRKVIPAFMFSKDSSELHLILSPITISVNGDEFTVYSDRVNVSIGKIDNFYYIFNILLLSKIPRKLAKDIVNAKEEKRPFSKITVYVWGITDRKSHSASIPFIRYDAEKNYITNIGVCDSDMSILEEISVKGYRLGYSVFYARDELELLTYEDINGSDLHFFIKNLNKSLARNKALIDRYLLLSRKLAGLLNVYLEGSTIW